MSRLRASILPAGISIVVALAVACGGEKEEERSAAVVLATATSAPSPVAQAEAERQWAFRGQRGITAAFVATDLDLYRSLLPSAFDMPETSLVAVAIVNYYDVTLPLTPYGEGYVVLQCRYQGKTGWYVLTMPVDEAVANAGGRALGFPKYVTNKIELSELSGGVWTGIVPYEGREVMRITFTPDPGARAAESTTTNPGLPVFLLVPPGEGPQINEVDINLFGEQRKVSTSGSATVVPGPGEAWAGLLPPEGIAASATLDELTGEWVLSGAPQPAAPGGELQPMR